MFKIDLGLKSKKYFCRNQGGKCDVLLSYLSFSTQISVFPSKERSQTFFVKILFFTFVNNQNFNHKSAVNTVKLTNPSE